MCFACHFFAFCLAGYTLRKGRQHGEKSKNFSHIIRLMTIRPRRCQSRWCDIRIFNPHPHKGATSGAYLVNSRTAVVNPTAKACFCQSSHSCNRASSVPVQACPTVCAGLPVQTSPVLACIAPHTGLLFLVSVFPPLTFPAPSAIIDLAAFRRCVGL